MLLRGRDEQVQASQQVPDTLVIQQEEGKLGLRLGERDHRLLFGAGCLAGRRLDRLQPCAGLLVRAAQEIEELFGGIATDLVRLLGRDQVFRRGFEGVDRALAGQRPVGARGCREDEPVCLRCGVRDRSRTGRVAGSCLLQRLEPGVEQLLAGVAVAAPLLEQVGIDEERCQADAGFQLDRVDRGVCVALDRREIFR